MNSELKMSEKSMIKEVKYRLDRIMNKNRAGSIFNQSEEIAIEWVLKDMLGIDTSDIEKRLVEARNKQESLSADETTEDKKKW